MNHIPAGPDGAPEPGRDVVEGKPGVYGGQAPPANWRQWARIVIWVIVAAIAAAFILKNNQSVTIDFVFFAANVPLFVALLLALLLGIILGATAMFGWQRRRAKAAAAARAGKKS